MTPTDKNTLGVVWRNESGKRVWAKLSDNWSKQRPVVWVGAQDDATEFSYVEAKTILKRYPETAGFLPIEGNTNAA